MRALIAIFALLIATGVFVACGSNGEPSGDETEIEDLTRRLYQAFEAKDAAGIIDVFIADCPDIEADVASGLEFFEGMSIDIDIADVDVNILSENEAEVQASGSIVIDGERQPLEESGYVGVIRVSGEWKYSDCEFIGNPE